jgi:hypothetical protein
MGRVAIIRDIGAATCVYHLPGNNPFSNLTDDCSFEAMLYFLYTGEITFAPFRSDPRRENPVEARTGDWATDRVPSPSAKSIYRLADKVTVLTIIVRSVLLAHRSQYDIPPLKKQAEAHIRKNLENCDIIEEIFSSFTYL